MYDVIIVGGGPAGLSAALSLGRMRRRVLVCDTGAGRNAVSHAAHNIFTRDGTPPAELRRIAREQLRPYKTVEVRDISVEAAAPSDGGFHVTLSDGAPLESRRLLLATGVIDVRPSIEGLSEYWGRGVYVCPYCDGWEHRDQPIAAYNPSATGVHVIGLLTLLSDDVTLFTDGPATLSLEERVHLLARNITIREERVLRVDGCDGALTSVTLDGGERVPCHALFVKTEQHQHSSLPNQLGCTINDQGFVEVDGLGRTSVPGVSAAGDMTRMPHQVIVAAADGAIAAAALNADLLTSGTH